MQGPILSSYLGKRFERGGHGGARLLKLLLPAAVCGLHILTAEPKEPIAMPADAAAANAEGGFIVRFPDEAGHFLPIFPEPAPEVHGVLTTGLRRDVEQAEATGAAAVRLSFGAAEPVAGPDAQKSAGDGGQEVGVHPRWTLAASIFMASVLIGFVGTKLLRL